ncbi:MAG: hypothetical protein ACO1NQ_09335 [Flavobacteriales bacterium]
MRSLEADGSLTGAARLLLGAVSGVPDGLLKAVRVFPRERNWLRFPWYAAAQGGGAFVMGDRIFAHRRFFEPGAERAFLFLLAHEVGHLPHAARFGASGAAKARFICWAAGHYLRSALTHGRHAHRLARIEQEAERGRWVLAELVRRTTGDPPFRQFSDAEAMTAWLQRHADTIAELHRRYPGWPLR